MRVKCLVKRGAECVIASLVSISVAQAVDSPELAGAIATINSRCPKSYPDVVIPVPEPGGLTGKSEAELLEMLTTWNPALRNSVSKELIARGDNVIPALKEMLVSDDWKKRAAAANSLANVVRHKVRNWKEVFPEETNWRVAQPKVRAKYAELIPLALPLFKDSQRDVRAAGLSLVTQIGIGNKPVSEAVLDLFGDPDEYIAQDAMGASKQLGIAEIDEAKILDAFAKGMKQPLPRGKGSIVYLIGKQPKEFQLKCVPLLLDHLAWVPKRDTMFGSGGQKEAITILTRLGEPTFIPQIEAVMYKKYKGRNEYFDAAVEAAGKFGPAARSVLPTLKKELVNVQSEIAEIEKAGINKRTKKTHDMLKARLVILNKAVENVEK